MAARTCTGCAAQIAPAPAATRPQSETEPPFGLPVRPGILLGVDRVADRLAICIFTVWGRESLAQINSELEYPKHKNLIRAGMVIFIYSLIFLVRLIFSYAIIPDAARPQYLNNIISGIAIYLAGPLPLELVFQAFIVFVGFLMLAGAINASIIGANGVLNRVSEDGVLTDWFRAPHHTYGTTHRIINLIVILQLIAIIASQQRLPIP